MFGNSDNNRSQDQGGPREGLSTKEGGGEDTAVGTRTGSEAAMRANSVLGNAKSNRHQKTHRVEPDGTGRKFTHLTRGGLRRESVGGVSRGHSSEESRGNPTGAKDLRVGETRIASSPWSCGREGLRNELGVTITVATRIGASGADGWNPVRAASAGIESGTGRRKGKR
jgi:hypothetical protein